jgi:uncharacterized protein YodC (DUF2158 family)
MPRGRRDRWRFPSDPSRLEALVKRIFKIGDTVTLKSAGHLMTIVSIERKCVTCAWSVKGDIKSNSFPADALIKADKPVTLEQLVLASQKTGDRA